GHVAMHVAHLPVVREVALGDVRGDDLVAVGDEFRCEVASDESVAAEDDVSHRASSLVWMESWEAPAASAWPLPPWAIRIVPTQIAPMPAMRQALRSSRNTKYANTATAT